MTLTDRDLAIVIWEFHKERMGDPELIEFRELEPHEQELLLSAGEFALRYIK